MLEIYYKLKGLIDEGEEVLSNSRHIESYTGLDYYKGEQYEKWISEGKLLLYNYFKDNPLTHDFNEAASRAVGYGKDYYDTMIGVLKALYEDKQYLSTKKEGRKKIFVSHSSKDVDFTNKFVNLLKKIGVTNDQIYYSSYEETGADLLENCLNRIKEEFINNDLLVMLMLSPSFYKSNICLAEMGATWISVQENYIPILLPPYTYDNISGVITNTQNSLMLGDQNIGIKLEHLKGKIEEFLSITEKVDSMEWEREKNEFIKFIKEKMNLFEAVSSKIESINLIDKHLVCKIKLINNTKKRLEFEEIDITIALSNGESINQKNNDWTVKSLLLKPLEELTFYTSLDAKEGIKRSNIKLNNSFINLDYYEVE